MENSIELEHVFKRYRKNLNCAKNTLGYLLHIPSPDDFWALEDISLQVQPGQVLGIIGPNGAGKSTLLKILSGVTQPSSGNVITKGKIGALIELGAGLHPELTGRENILLYGSIMGMQRREIEQKFEEMVEFSGLREFLNTPVKFYSSGMLVRLGFTVTVFTAPDILLIDEVLAVGDLHFQRICLEKIRQLLKKGVAIVLVSHNLENIKTYAHQVMLLANGKKIIAGDYLTVVSAYHGNLLTRPPHHQTSFAVRHGTGEVTITSVELLDASLRPVTEIMTGKDYVFRIHYRKKQPVANMNIGIGFYGVDESYLMGVTTQMDQVSVPLPPPVTAVDFHISNCPLMSGNYYINAEIFGQDEQAPYDFIEHVLFFTVRGAHFYRGLINLPHRWGFS